MIRLDNDILLGGVYYYEIFKSKDLIHIYLHRSIFQMQNLIYLMIGYTYMVLMTGLMVMHIA